MFNVGALFGTSLEPSPAGSRGAPVRAASDQIASPIKEGRGREGYVAADVPCGAARNLAIQVLVSAFDDVVKYRDATSGAKHSEYMRARSWILSADRVWPYSFLNLCDLLNLPAERIRQSVFTRTTPINMSGDS